MQMLFIVFKIFQKFHGAQGAPHVRQEFHAASNSIEWMLSSASHAAY